MKVAVIGSRVCKNRTYVNEVLAHELAQSDIIISGGAPGADRLAEEFAEKTGRQAIIFLPDWDKYGRGAGFVRNHTIIRNADRLIAFWDGQSRGAADAIRKAEKKKLDITIYPATQNSVRSSARAEVDKYLTPDQLRKATREKPKSKKKLTVQADPDYLLGLA